MQRLTLSVALLIGGLQVSAAADLKAVELGHDIAVARCARCHSVTATDASPHRTPPFRELAADYPVAMLTDALKTGVIGGHDEMPMFDLGSSEARALIAYIDSLSPPGKRYLD